ncbi:neogenin isoform X3 [Homalodisca vitripennis]|uniref:neogenin isoform X3 n=1 Tax=Homalodisca vitripennis TaxID=197043 RepID=UPI001EEB0AD3|nr:neogenin isoform X3 [Homalodisca vitripennis]
MEILSSLILRICLFVSLTFRASIVRAFGDAGVELKFTLEPQDVVTVAGRSVVLDCAAHSSDTLQPPTLKWRTADGQDLTFIGDPHRRQLSNNSLLILSVVENQEQYHCVATVDSVGSIVSRTATVTLAHLPPLERQPQDLRLFPGQTALFSCLVEGNPPPLVTWIKDGRPLVLDETRMIILPSGSLEIESVQVSDRGNYRCNVSGHGQHRLSDRAILQVDQDLESAASLMAPTFIAKPRSTVATEGSTVTLECAANGTPNPWLVWLKDGVPIDLADLDTNCILLGTGSLQMRDVEEDDAGNYQCRAENREDSVDATATLQVHVAPRFLKRPRNKIAKEKEDVELECSVYARPDAKVSWLKNGDHIKQNEYLQVVNGNNLRILGLMAQDTGIFQCVASNPAGNIQAAAHLTVVSSEYEMQMNLSKNPPMKRPSIPPGLSALEGEVEVPQQETAPRDVEAAIVGARFVTMRWRPPPQPQGNISSYSVFYREEGSFRERIVNTSRSRLEEVNIQGLQPDRTYVVRVGAYMNHSLGATSMPVLVRTKAEVHVPGPPRHVTARPLSPTAIRVNWQPPAPDTITTPVHGYSLYYLEAEASEEFHRNTTELGYTLENLNKFQEYNVWVVAHNENGAGMASEEITVRTFSDVPSKAPENITLEAASSSMVYVRWEPPPKDGQNGVITGYKVRYRKKDLRGRGDTHTTAGNQRAFLIQNLEKKSMYQVRLFAVNVNGTGPPTDWYNVETYENDLDESIVPDVPSTMKVKPSTDSITVSWTPPVSTEVLVRGYYIGWGKGIPDMYYKILDSKQRYYVIEGLEPNSEYVISLRASNNVGDGPAKYESVRTRDEAPPEPMTPLIPPVGLKAIVLSSSTVVVYWTDSTLSQSQLVTDNRYYTVRYASCHHSGNPRYKYYNSTDLNYMIDDLKPNTQYEFTVKVVKGRRESRWSMVVSNTTMEDAPSSPPRDLTVVAVDGNPTIVNLNWQPPKQPNGQITGYVVSYTTDMFNRDRDWVVEGVVGDKMTTSIKGLTASTTYYFKIQARNSKGYGPMSGIVSMTTNSDGRGGLSNMTLLLILLACCVLLIAGVAIGIAIVCCRKASVSQDRSKKGYTKGNTGKPGASNIKPPDLWIHHDQMDLKNMEKSSQGSLDVPSSARDLDIDQPRQPTNSLDKRTYGTSYIGNASQPLLLPEEKCSSARRAVKPKPIALPVENQPLREPTATATTPIGPAAGLLTVTDARPLYPRTQYSISRAHVTLDPALAAAESPIIQSGGGGYESVAGSGAPVPAPTQTSTYGVTGEGTGSLGKRLQGHPLKSFSVPAPPPQSAPSTPQQKHVVTVRPQGSSPYKKAGHYTTQGQAQSPAPTKTRPSTLDDSPKLQPSYSTEELNQEMANLEGLMKDLNAITASEFEC